MRASAQALSLTRVDRLILFILHCLLWPPIDDDEEQSNIVYHTINPICCL
jgi:hypothetical protein